jgi:hypothetical protein
MKEPKIGAAAVAEAIERYGVDIATTFLLRLRS